MIDQVKEHESGNLHVRQILEDGTAHRFIVISGEPIPEEVQAFLDNQN